MKLTFLGTRGEIEARTRRHRMHSSLLVTHRGKKVMIDCGLDWLGKFQRLHLDAIVLTHAHPDHAWGLRSEERRVGKECRSRWSRYHLKKNEKYFRAAPGSWLRYMHSAYTASTPESPAAAVSDRLRVAILAETWPHALDRHRSVSRCVVAL